VIIDVPTTVDFETNGLAFLNLAWDSIADLSQTYHSIKEHDFDPEYVSQEETAKAEAEYWQNSQPALATAVALAHQGGEFLLKAKIASVSPFLLLDVDKWPANTDGMDRSFADFKTVDAQELIKIHDNVCANPLPERFKTGFENLRKLRNTIMHSINRREPFTPREGILAILDIVDTLVGKKSWQTHRRKYQDRKSNSWDPFGYSQFNPLHASADETMHIINELLKPAEALKYYGFNKKQRTYNCLNCYEPNSDGPPKSVQLKEASPDATEAYCVSCQTTIKVKREQCRKCVSNVFGLDSYDESWFCLTCNDSFLKDEEQEDTV